MEEDRQEGFAASELAKMELRLIKSGKLNLHWPIYMMDKNAPK